MMKELRNIMENYWIIKDNNKDLYYQIKDQIPQFKIILIEKLGYQLVVNPYFIKLEKLAG